MLRLLAHAVLALLANTVGLLIASWLIDGFNINATGFITAVVIFTLATVVLGPLMASIALKNVPALVGGVSLLTTLVGLMITDLIGDGLSISGLDSWIAATVVVWLCSLLAGFLLPLFLFKKTLDKHQENKAEKAEV